MLQQTRVETVVPYFEAWMARWPTVRALAVASEQDVLEAWQGLGYYNRARRLLAAAWAVVADHDGEVPVDPAALAKLPGFGPYTVGAVASIAHDVPIPCVDGNVARVVARLEAWEVDVREPKVRRRVHDHLTTRVPSPGAGRFTVALMELGATVCTPKAPRCEICPVVAWCSAHETGVQEQVPLTGPRQRPTEVQVVAWLHRRGDRIWMTERPPGLLGGLWGLPMEEGVPDGQVVARVSHTFTHRRWQVHVHEATGPPAGAGRWIDPTAPDVPLSTLDRKVIAAVGDASVK